MQFVLVACFILLQLVIAVLMEQLARQFGQDLSGTVVQEDTLQGCEVLTKKTLSRIERRWHYNAQRLVTGKRLIKLRKESFVRKAYGLNLESLARTRYGTFSGNGSGSGSGNITPKELTPQRPLTPPL